MGVELLVRFLSSRKDDGKGQCERFFFVKLNAMLTEKRVTRCSSKLVGC